MALQVAALSKPRRVVVAAETLNEGSRITHSDLRVKMIPRAFLPDDYLRDSRTIIGREVRADIFKEEPIARSRVAGSPSRRASTMIASGRVGLAVAVDDVSGVGGGVRPDDLVDVLVTDEEIGKTNLLYQNVRVVGVGGTYPFGPDPGGSDDDLGVGPAAGAPAIILELTPGQAKRVTEASESGSVRLALRAAVK